MLNKLTKECSNSQSIEWQKTLKLIEVFQITEKLEQSCLKKIFNEDELKQYAEFETKIKSNQEKKQFEKDWAKLVEELNNNIHHKPDSSIDISLGEQFMQCVNNVYGKEYAHLRTKNLNVVLAKAKA